MRRPPDSAERRPLDKTGALDIAHDGGDRSNVRHPRRELEAWALAVEHLHERGLPAAVPPFAARWLRRRGVRADWEAAA